MQITNESGIALPLAVWLLHDDYDYIDKPNYISVTTLMRPLKQIILPGRIPATERKADVADFIARTLGSSIHDSIEKSWTKGYARAMRMLGYPDEIIARIAVNPTDEEVRDNPKLIPIFLENRLMRDFDNYTIGGKFDMVADGIVQDNKSTSAWGWVFGTRDDEHRLQMSLYRWIDAAQPVPKIKEDYAQVNYVFTDWQKAQARTNPKYPQQRVEQKTLELMSLDETEAFVRMKLALIRQHRDANEDQMPQCTDEELWRSDPQYKYYADPAKATVPGSRSTKNFDNMAEARSFQAEKGGKGVIITKPGEVKACGYCPAFDGCKQKDQYLSDA